MYWDVAYIIFKVELELISAFNYNYACVPVFMRLGGNYIINEVIHFTFLLEEQNQYSEGHTTHDEQWTEKERAE